MAYLDDFDHDIFISFAHVDNQDGWVEVFQQQLEAELSRLIGRLGEVELWFDKRRLQAGQRFDQTIEDALNRTAVFVALTSKGYFHPDSYCRKEIQWFSQKAQREPWGLNIGDRNRIFNAQLANLAAEQWPQELGGTIWAKFHDAEDKDQPGYPLDPKDKRFLEQIRRLSEAIFATLEAIKHSPKPAASAAAQSKQLAAAKAAHTVFLADTADSLRRLRHRVAEELQRQNIAVVAAIPPPYEAIPHDEKVTAELRGATLSVHFFDQWESRDIEGQPAQTYAQRQAELALQHSSEVLIWVPQTLDVQAIEVESHRQFLHQLESGQRNGASYEFLRESKTEITRQILTKLEQIKAKQMAAAMPSAALLDSHRKDQLHAMEMYRVLMERNVQPYINPEDDDPRSNLKILEERLKQVSKLILFFGAVAEDWVRARLAEALKIAVEQRCPLKTLAVCFVPPHRKEEGIRFDPGFAQVHHFNFEEMNDPETLRLLLGGIQ